MDSQLSIDEINVSRTNIRTYIEQFTIPISQVAKAVGKSSSTLSQFFSGKYQGDNSRLALMLRAWVDKDLKQRRSPKPGGFVSIRLAKIMMGALEYAAKRSMAMATPANIEIIYGPAGWGKTMTLQYYKRQHPETLLIRPTAMTTTAISFLHLLCDELNVYHGNASKAMLNPIVEKLAGSNRMIIIDEAHRLLGDRRANHYKIFEVIRDIHDLTGCPIVLVGTSLIVQSLDEGLREAKGWITDQFNSRICLIKDLTTILANGGGKTEGLAFSVDEIAKIFKSQRLKLHPQAGRWLAKLASIPGKGGLRTVQSIQVMCEVLFPDAEVIDLSMAKSAFANIWNGDTGPTLTEEVTPGERIAAAG